MVERWEKKIASYFCGTNAKSNKEEAAAKGKIAIIRFHNLLLTVERIIAFISDKIHAWCTAQTTAHQYILASSQQKSTADFGAF